MIPLVPSLELEAIVIWVHSPLSKVPDWEVHTLHRTLLTLPIVNVAELQEREDPGLADYTQEPPGL